MRYLPVLFALLFAGCSTTFTKEQAQRNEQILATAFMECVWTIDPATYFDDEKLAAHKFTWRPRRLGPGEYVDLREEVVEGYGLNTYEEDKRADLPTKRSGRSGTWGRVFHLPLPIATAGALVNESAEPRLPMDAMVLLHVWRTTYSVYPPVDDQPFTDWMEILTVKAVRTIDDQRYLASRMSRDDQAAPLSVRRFADLLRDRGVPLFFEVIIPKKVIGATTYHGGDALRYLFEDVALRSRTTGEDAGLSIEDTVAKDSNFDVDLEAPPRLHSVRLGMTSGVGSPADRCQALLERGEHREVMARRAAAIQRSNDRINRRVLARMEGERDSLAALATRTKAEDSAAQWAAARRGFESGLDKAAQSFESSDDRAARTAQADRAATARADAEGRAVDRRIAASEREAARAKAKASSSLRGDEQALEDGWEALEARIDRSGRWSHRMSKETVRKLQADRDELQQRRTALNKKRKRAGMTEVTERTHLDSYFFDEAQRDLDARATWHRSTVRAQVSSHLGKFATGAWTDLDFISDNTGLRISERHRHNKDGSTHFEFSVTNTNAYPVEVSAKHLGPVGGPENWGYKELAADATSTLLGAWQFQRLTTDNVQAQFSVRRTD